MWYLKYTHARTYAHTYKQHRDALWFREPRVLPPAFHMIGKLSHRGEPGMWRGASTTMAERSHGPSIMRLFYTVAIWVTIIHRTKGIPWTQEKVGLNKLGGFFFTLACLCHSNCVQALKKTVSKSDTNLPHAVLIVLSCNLPTDKAQITVCHY